MRPFYVYDGDGCNDKAEIPCIWEPSLGESTFYITRALIQYKDVVLPV